MFSLAQPFRPAVPAPSSPSAAGFETVLAGLVGGEPSVSQVVEVSGGTSSGKSTLALHLCLVALREGRAAGWIDSGQGFHPLAALESREPLGRLLVVRVPDGSEALRAADLLLTSAGAVAVAVVALPSGYKPAGAALLRLQRLAERSGAVLLLLDDQLPQAPSLGAAVTLRLCVRRPAGTEDGDNWGLALEVLRNKSGPCGPMPRVLLHGPDRLRQSLY